MTLRYPAGQWPQRIVRGLSAALFLAGLSAMPLAFAAELIRVDKQAFKIADLPDKPGLRVIVSQPMTLKLGGAVGLMGYRWTLEEGTYKAPRQSVIDGHEVVLLPIRIMLSGKPASAGGGSGGSVGACYQADGHFIAVDVATGNVLNRGLLRNIVAKSCGGGSRMDWVYTFASVQDPGDVRILWGEDMVESDQRALERGERARGLEGVAEAYLDANSRDDKSKIGARICQENGGIRYVGFTEGVSADTGKIQIRIADAMVGGNPRMRPGGFQPSIIWDTPDDWELCE